MANIFRKKTTVILACVVLCIAGQMFVRPVVSGDSGKGLVMTDPNLLGTSEVFNLDALDLTSNDGSARNNLMKKFGYAIFFVIILGSGAFYFTRKFIPKLVMSRGKNISVIETISLGPNKMLHLIQVNDNQKLLVGSTSQSINLLAHIGDSMSEAFRLPSEED